MRSRRARRLCACSRCGVVSRMRASCASLLGWRFELVREDHSDFTGVESASGSPIAVDDAAAMRGHFKIARDARRCPASEETRCRSTAGTSSGRRADEQKRERPEYESARETSEAVGRVSRDRCEGAPALTSRPPPSACARPRTASTWAAACEAAPRATFSTRAGMPHVDCSSCSWPNSVSYSRASACARSSSTKIRRVLVARCDERHRTQDEHRQEQQIHSHGADSTYPRGQPAGIASAVRSATRSTALRERGLRAISEAPGLIARPTRVRARCRERVGPDCKPRA
jgi:hypothetical protein